MTALHIGMVVLVTEFEDRPKPVAQKLVITTKPLLPVDYLPRIKSQRLGYVTGGTFYGDSGRISNHWRWCYFDSDGVLSKEGDAGCNNGNPWRLESANITKDGGEYEVVITLRERQPQTKTED